MHAVTLFGYPTSPFVMKVGCYLKYKAIPYDFVPVNPVSPVAIKFTGQRQVPVLKIDDEWRKDSSSLGIWLDEVFPDKPLLGHTPKERDTILHIDNWVSDHLIPARFRAAVEWEKPLQSIKNGWILAKAVNDATRIPPIIRVLWPFLVKRAGFIRDMVARMNLEEPMDQMRERLCHELEQFLLDGPFLGGQSSVSLADLSAYPTVVSAHLMGMHQDSPFYRSAAIVDWCRRVQQALPDNPLLVPDELIVRGHL